MQEVLDGVERRQAQGQRVAFARVVGAAWSEPREAGATMPVNEDGDAAGSVFGEPDLDQAVVRDAIAALETGPSAIGHVGARTVAPVGIDVGARTADETAIGVVAEVMAHQADVPVSSLRNGSRRLRQVIE